MPSKNATRVTIGGKTYTLSGNESEEYLQEVAAYLNGKIAQLQGDEDYRNVPFDMRNVLLQLNLADDYFKARSEIRQMQKLLEEREQNLSDLKHELVATQMKLEAAVHRQE
jgi:cell division protein ZapA